MNLHQTICDFMRMNEIYGMEIQKKEMVDRDGKVK